MPAVRENWVDIVGRVQSIAGDDTTPDFTAVTLEVESVEPVDDYPRFVDERPQGPLRILVRNDVVREAHLRPGDRLRCRTRWAPPDRLFAHPTGLHRLDS